MLRALLAEDHPPEFYTDIEFVTVALEARRDLGDEDSGAFIAFLEEMFTCRPAVFNLGADWFVRQMAYAYVRGGRDGDIARLLPPLLGDEYEPHEALFDLEDLIRLADLSEESRRLTFAMLKQTGHGGYMGWAIEELIEFAGFFLHGDAINAGCTPEALSELRRQLAQIDCNPPEDKLNAMLSQRGGTAGRQFMLEDLLGHKEPAGFNLYLLSLDFGRWLAEEWQLPPLVADTMRCFVFWCLVEMREESDRNPLTLHQQRLDKYLARLLGVMSLLHLRGVATLIGMRHFHDFLLSVNLIDEGEHRRARRICDDLWSQMHRALGIRRRTTPSSISTSEFRAGAAFMEGRGDSHGQQEQTRSRVDHGQAGVPLELRDCADGQGTRLEPAESDEEHPQQEPALEGAIARSSASCASTTISISIRCSLSLLCFGCFLAMGRLRRSLSPSWRTKAKPATAPVPTGLLPAIAPGSLVLPRG